MEATFCIVDLAGFTALTETHGDTAAADLALRFSGLAGNALANDGRLLKTMGDAALVATPHPDGALRFLSRLWTVTAKEPDFPALRAGVHHGSAVERDGDVFGSAVNLAARVAARASGEQVLATGQVANAAREAGIEVTNLGRFTLRNLREPVELFSLGLGMKDSSELDPVCRMRVNRGAAAGRLSLGGTMYWFCSLRCAGLFAADPAAYINSGAPSS